MSIVCIHHKALQKFSMLNNYHLKEIESITSTTEHASMFPNLQPLKQEPYNQ